MHHTTPQGGANHLEISAPITNHERTLMGMAGTRVPNRTPQQQSYMNIVHCEGQIGKKNTERGGIIHRHDIGLQGKKYLEKETKKMSGQIMNDKRY